MNYDNDTSTGEVYGSGETSDYAGSPDGGESYGAPPNSATGDEPMSFYQAEMARDQHAEQRFDSEVERHFASTSSYPDSTKEAITGLAWQLVLNNPQVYQALRNGSDTGGIADAFKRASYVLDKIYKDYKAHPASRNVMAKAQGTRNLTQVAADYLAANEQEQQGRIPAVRRVTGRGGGDKRPMPQTSSKFAPGTRNLQQIAADYLAGYSEQEGY